MVHFYQVLIHLFIVLLSRLFLFFQSNFRSSTSETLRPLEPLVTCQAYANFCFTIFSLICRPNFFLLYCVKHADLIFCPDFQNAFETMTLNGRYAVLKKRFVLRGPPKIEWRWTHTVSGKNVGQYLLTFSNYCDFIIFISSSSAAESLTALLTVIVVQRDSKW